jgi:cell division protein FtsL
MATLATFVNRFAGVRELAGVAPAIWTRTESPRLRPIANEDVYLFVKRIDNTAVARAVDPAARTARSRSMATGFLAALLVIAGLVPAAYNTTAGFTLEHLRGEQTQLRQQMAKLQASEAQLVSMERLEQLAKTLKMSEPAPQQVETLQGTSSKAEAHNDLPLSSVDVAR